MDLVGVVEIPGGAIDQESWLAAIDSEVELEQMEPAEGINPFTKAPMLYQRPHSAWIVMGGQRIGSIVWDADSLHVSGSDPRVLTCAKAIARRFHASFVRPE